MDKHQFNTNECNGGGAHNSNKNTTHVVVTKSCHVRVLNSLGTQTVRVRTNSGSERI